MLSANKSAHRRHDWWKHPAASLIAVASFFIAHPAFTQTSSAPEISTQEADANFTLKTERNTVLVPVVVRDSKGNPVENLRKEDFRIFDRGKPQAILSFSIEKPLMKAHTQDLAGPGEKPATQPADAEADRYVALYFDDINSSEADLAHTREATARFLLTSMQPGDRVGLFTASGRKQVDFTSNLRSIQEELANLHRHIDHSINSIPPYIAYLATEQNDQTALSLLLCRPNEAPVDCAPTATQATAQATFSLSYSDSLSLMVLRRLDAVLGQMSSLPGQRTLVILSAGFQTYSTTFLPQIDKIIDTAIRGHVVINALNARGLYGDLSVTDLDDQEPQTQDRIDRKSTR